MPRKKKIDLAAVLAALNTACTKCGYSIPPDQIRRIDFDHIQCPACGERFVPAKRQ
jgi:predicted RNA-binding Zn-ribbon protein involved in translation (DUF1610 family)